MNGIIAFIADLDRSITTSINGFAGRSSAFDRGMMWLSDEPFIEGGFLFLFLWWLWFSNGESRSGERIRAIRTAFGIVVALTIARAMQILLPGRPRPVNDLTLSFVVPSELNYKSFEHWSSFPSDHAVIYCAIATAIWFKNRWLGALAFAWSLVFGSLPRLYLGLHYTTDVVGGVLLGAAVAYLAQVVRLPVAITNAVQFLEWRHSQIFYPLAVLFTIELMNLFGDVRSVGWAVANVLF